MSAQAKMRMRPASFAEFVGWARDDHAAAFRTFLRSCDKILAQRSRRDLKRYLGAHSDWRRICTAARSHGGRVDRRSARSFFESWFEPVEILPGGGHDLFTGYFEPEVEGAREPSPDYRVPLFRRPAELVKFSARAASKKSAKGLKYGHMVAGKPRPYLTRAAIEKGALSGRGLELVYLKDRVDAFFLHIQGSGRVRLSDGGVMRVAFAAKNGHPYTSIGSILVKWGEMTLQSASMQTIRAWLRNNPSRVDELLWSNASFIFFRELDNVSPELGPVGAQGLPLTPGRSLAVDKAYHSFGAPMWVETKAPEGNTRLRPWHRLVIAQDTGSAIKGPLRGDIFFGSGDAAGAIAGRMKSPGRLFVLRPRRGGTGKADRE